MSAVCAEESLQFPIGALIGQTMYLLRKLASRPHPFVDVSS